MRFRCRLCGMDFVLTQNQINQLKYRGLGIKCIYCKSEDVEEIL